MYTEERIQDFWANNKDFCQAGKGWEEGKYYIL